MSDSKKTILYFEPDPVFARVVRAKCENDGGWKVSLASNIDEAIKLFKEIKPALFLIELLHNEEDGRTGFDLLKEINIANKDINAQIIVLTELSQDVDKKLALEHGASHYFVKSQVSIFEVIKYLKGVL